TAEAQGENRAREVTEKLLAHPLLDEGALLAEAGGVLVTIAGGTSLTLGEVNRIMEQIDRQCEHAQITLGAAVDETLQDRIVVTLVASRRGSVEVTPRAGESAGAEAPPGGGLMEETWTAGGQSRSSSRFVPPPPALSPERAEELFVKQTQGGGRARKNASRLKQGQLPLEIVSRGRFE